MKNFYLIDNNKMNDNIDNINSAGSDNSQGEEIEQSDEKKIGNRVKRAEKEAKKAKREAKKAEREAGRVKEKAEKEKLKKEKNKEEINKQARERIKKEYGGIVNIIESTIEEHRVDPDNFKKGSLKHKKKVFAGAYKKNPLILEEKLKKFKKIGFSPKQITGIFERFPGVFQSAVEKIGTSIDWLNAHGMEPDIDYFTKRPLTLFYKEETLNNRLESLEKIYFPYHKYFDVLFHSKKNWKKFLERQGQQYQRDKKYVSGLDTMEEVRKRAQGRIWVKFSFLLKSKEEIEECSPNHPFKVITRKYDIDPLGLEEHLTTFEKQGFSPKQIIFIFSKFPHIVNCSVETIRELTEWFRDHKIENDYLVKYPNRFFSNKELLDRRYNDIKILNPYQKDLTPLFYPLKNWDRCIKKYLDKIRETEGEARAISIESQLKNIGDN